MKPKVTINELVLNEEIEEERLRNTTILNKLRIITVSAFFSLHLVMGFAFNSTKFRGKELLFSIYLLFAIVLFSIPHSKRGLKLLSEFSIPLLDMPMTYLILNSWILSITDDAIFKVLGTLGLSFMMFFTHLSGLFFSGTVTMPTTLAGIAIALQLFRITETPPDTRITGVLLLGLTGYATLRISTRVKKLLAQTAQKQSLNEKLSRYFAPEVATAIAHEHQSRQSPDRTFDVSVLFVDIRDFTKMSSTMTGEQVINMLNEIHEHLISCIFLTGGTLDKYLGDGVMAYFGAPVSTEEHADKALECALFMRMQIEQYNEKRAARGAEKIHIGIGIHSGPAIVGDIGAEIRREFTVIGDTVNTASRIENLTKKHRVDILFTSATRDRLQKFRQMRSLGIDEIRGSGVQLELFTV